jgi:hypothetical protein
MAARLTQWLVQCAGDWRLVVAVFVCQGLLIFAMLQIGKPFEQRTGFPPFDFQSELSVAAMATQLPNYDAQARLLYYGMSAIDFAFPLLGGLFWTLLFAAGLRIGWPQSTQGPFVRALLLLPFAGTAADWAENVANLRLIAAFPPFDPGTASVALLAKQAKLAIVSLSAVLAVGTFLAGLARRALLRRRTT